MRKLGMRVWVSLGTIGTDGGEGAVRDGHDRLKVLVNELSLQNEVDMILT
jgi:hypothetical protein